MRLARNGHDHCVFQSPLEERLTCQRDSVCSRAATQDQPLRSDHQSRRDSMSGYTDAPTTMLDQAARWLLAAVRALLGWVFISINAMLPFARLPEMDAAGRVLLITASVLSVGTGFILLLWAAHTIRARG